MGIQGVWKRQNNRITSRADEDGETITKVISIRMVTIRRGWFVKVVKEAGYDNMDKSTKDIPRYTYTRPGISLVSNVFFVEEGERHSR